MTMYEITREQFFNVFPPETRNITLNDEIIAELGEEVICDHCNCDVFYHLEDVNMSHGFAICYDDNHVDEILCKECAENMIKEYNLKKS